MSRRAKLALSLTGVALSVIGFYVSNAPAFPLVQAVIAPSYVGAKSALDSLRQDGDIRLGATGFTALAKLIENRIAEQNPQVARSTIVLERLETGGGGIAFGQSTSRQIVGLKMFLRGQEEPLEWDLLEISTDVEDIWKGRSLSWAVWPFWLGVLQTVWPLFVETTAKTVEHDQAEGPRNKTLQPTSGVGSTGDSE